MQLVHKTWRNSKKKQYWKLFLSIDYLNIKEIENTQK